MELNTEEILKPDVQKGKVITASWQGSSKSSQTYYLLKNVVTSLKWQSYLAQECLVLALVKLTVYCAFILFLTFLFSTWKKKLLWCAIHSHIFHDTSPNSRLSGSISATHSEGYGIYSRPGWKVREELPGMNCMWDSINPRGQSQGVCAVGSRILNLLFQPVDQSLLCAKQTYCEKCKYTLTLT